MNLIIRQATADDVPALLEIERECFADSLWQAEDFAKDDCRVAELGGTVAGFIVSKEIFAGDAGSLPEREILNVAVRSCFRRKRVASALLREQFAHPAIYFLEVRQSNVAAQALYARFGFVEIARRQGYYHSPVESAIVMRMKWC